MSVIDLVEFGIGDSLYALDISLAREIVEMMPVTPVPGTPSYIAGIINLRGEITNIISLESIMGLKTEIETAKRKIIVLVPGAAGNSHTGIIVDDVQSVIQVPEEDIEPMDDSLSAEAFVKGIIRTREEDGSTKLVIWLDLEEVMGRMTGRG